MIHGTLPYMSFLNQPIMYFATRFISLFQQCISFFSLSIHKSQWIDCSEDLSPQPISTSSNRNFLYYPTRVSGVPHLVNLFVFKKPKMPSSLRMLLCCKRISTQKLKRKTYNQVIICLMKTAPAIFRQSHNQRCKLNTKDLFYSNLPYTKHRCLECKDKNIFISINTMSFCNKPAFHKQSLLTWISHIWEI